MSSEPSGDHIDRFVAQFPSFLEAYDRHCPFTRYGQLEYHVETIHRLRELGSTEAALKDVSFQTGLYRTLEAWGIGSRGSVLRPLPSFVAALGAKAEEIRDLEGLTIDQRDLDVSSVAKKLAHLIQDLDIVDNKIRVVPGSKALHHLLPELVVPIDREYTQRFFDWPNSRFQKFPEKCFIEAFHVFARIARAANLSQYVGRSSWYTSRAKVIDNAVVGLWCWVRHELTRQAKRETGGAE